MWPRNAVMSHILLIERAAGPVRVHMLVVYVRFGACQMAGRRCRVPHAAAPKCRHEPVLYVQPPFHSGFVEEGRKQKERKEMQVTSKAALLAATVSRFFSLVLCHKMTDLVQPRINYFRKIFFFRLFFFSPLVIIYSLNDQPNQERKERFPCVPEFFFFLIYSASRNSPLQQGFAV